jgi:SAM-dependent methyltransferase
MLIGGEIGYRLLSWISPPERKRSLPPSSSPEPAGPSKLVVHWGEQVWRQLAGKTVIDFGCGFGAEAIDMARHGARRVIGLDIRPAVLERARAAAARAGVADRCTFATSTDVRADVIASVDAFEHFDDPAAILGAMARLLAPGGWVLASFGPTWFHPHGGHGFSVFPWAHLLFSERALLRWRAGFKDDGATRFGEVAGGLNQMTIGRFRRLVWQSGFRFARFETIPIRAARPLCNRLTRELFTSLVRCKLVRPGAAAGVPVAA